MSSCSPLKALFPWHSMLLRVETIIYYSYEFYVSFYQLRQTKITLGSLCGQKILEVHWPNNGMIKNWHFLLCGSPNNMMWTQVHAHQKKQTCFDVFTFIWLCSSIEGLQAKPRIALIKMQASTSIDQISHSQWIYSDNSFNGITSN